MTRRLPSRVNPLLAERVSSYSELVDLRRLGQTNLGSGKHQGADNGLFSYVHLRAPLPEISNSEIFGATSPESYFLMRRSSDGFVSCTGMFKAAFPWATKREEDEERKYVKDHFLDTSKDETAGNLWVHPRDALILAAEYGMTMWIEALLDNRPVNPSDKKRIISPPPPFYKDGFEAPAGVADMLAPPTVPAVTSNRRRSTRSSSPSKRVLSPRKARLAKNGIAKDSPLRSETLVVNGLDRLNEIAASTNGNATVNTTVTAEETVTTETVVEEVTIKKEPTIKVEVDTIHETNGDFEVDKTHVKVEYPAEDAKFHPYPETTEDMISKAKAMVEETKKLDGDNITKKRKADEILSKEDDSQEDDSSLAPHAKRAKGLERDLKKEKIKTKALIGLSIGLTLTALIPHFL